MTGVQTCALPIWAGFMIKPVFMAAGKYDGGDHRVIAAKVAVVLIGLGVLADIFS